VGLLQIREKDLETHDQPVMCKRRARGSEHAEGHESERGAFELWAMVDMGHKSEGSDFSGKDVEVASKDKRGLKPVRATNRSSTVLETLRSRDTKRAKGEEASHTLPRHGEQNL
jgi:hypothetical protein